MKMNIFYKSVKDYQRRKRHVFESRDETMSEIAKQWKATDFENHIPSDKINDIINHDLPRFKSAYARLTNNL